ncbi:arylsulfatase [Paenibacillus mucilaginosus KNP414]|uniref:Arylsulfatase n=2 Tax=Paenibacillus mucilaginosus TaxID=61624 RepID=F8FLF1_PAEMK|nr:arylsulfatase [Paenibacillus mucilaginosus KNP414]
MHEYASTQDEFKSGGMIAMAYWEKETFEGTIGRTTEESVPSWTERGGRAAPGAPNVVIILLDDLGFAQLGCYGSDIATPNIDALAAGGLRYNNFHTTALCSPTRAALLSGRNPHSVGLRSVLMADSGFPNARGRVSKSAALLSEILVENGYNTFAVGKWHLNTSQEQSFSGPFDNWPLGRGFEHFYGFLGGATSQWNPDLVEDNKRVKQPARAEDGYHLTEDLTEKAIDYIREQQTAAPDKPFFCYLAYGATHAPHHAPKEYIDKYKGRFDQGWDLAREQYFARQQALGIIPPDAELPPRSPDVLPWEELSEEQKRLYARLQEAFAGFLEHTDHHIGRLVQALKDFDQLDNTLFILLSDNGACSMGGDHGTVNNWGDMHGAEPLESKLSRIDEIGTPLADNHYPKGWAQVGNTPLRWYKSFVHAGGVKDPLIIHYPQRIQDGGGIRGQYHHVTDIVPTVLELTGLSAPAEYKGVPQQPIHGTSLAYTFEDGDEPTRKTTQIYEMVGNRAIYHEGWKAVAVHRPDTDFEEDVWELYRLTEDFSEVRDVAAEYPEKLEELVQLWWSEAEKYGFLPLERRSMRAILQNLGARKGPQPPGERVFYRSELGLPMSKSPDIRGKAFEITAEIYRDDISAEGVLVASGGRAGGYAWYIQDNRLVFGNNIEGVRYQYIESAEELPAGELKLRFVYTPEGENEGTGRLYLGDRHLGEGKLQGSAAIGFAFGQFNIGENGLTPVVPQYQVPFRFGGELKKVVYVTAKPEWDAKAAAELELATE